MKQTIRNKKCQELTIHQLKEAFSEPSLASLVILPIQYNVEYKAMKLSYSSLKDADQFSLTDFSCSPARDLLNRNDLFKIIWSKSRMTRITIDNSEYDLKADEIIFCTPFNVVDLPTIVEDFSAFVFNKEFFCIQTHDDQVSCQGFLFFGSSQPVTITMTAAEKESFERLLDLFKEDLNIKDHLQGEMLRSLLKRLLIQSTRMAKQRLPEPTISNAQMNIIREYNLLVEKHFREFHTVKEYANLLFKSPKTLSNFFPKYTDKSPLAMIQDRILLEARRLLLYSDKSTNEISQELGYKDAGHFSKFFKKHEGKSPSAFRKDKMAISLS